MSEGLQMKYFVLKPSGGSAYARASRRAMLQYARDIDVENPVLAKELREWVKAEALSQMDHETLEVVERALLSEGGQG